MPERDWILNPSDFAFLWEECRRCFYLKVVDKFPRPRIILPPVFRIIDTLMKKRYAGEKTGDALPFLNPGVIDSSVSRVQSVPVSVPGRRSTCTIRGKLDAVVRFNDGTFGVIDFKTSSGRERDETLYSRQLHGYAFALERAVPGHLSLSPVVKLGLVVFEPRSFEGGGSSPAMLIGRVHWKEIVRDDPGFYSFLSQVVGVLEQGVPPPSSPSCEWCHYRDKSRKFSL
jgi:hypothetical protein